MRDPCGLVLLTWTRSPRLRRRGDRLLPRREAWYRVVMGSKWFLVHWKPYSGLWCVSVAPVGVIVGPEVHSYPRPERTTMKRRAAPAATEEIKLPVSRESVFLADLPLLFAHCNETSYEDLTPRVPGYFWVMNRETAMEVIVFDPDSGSRLPCRAPDLDSAFLLAERLLGTPDAPWQPDGFLGDQLAKRRKGRKKGS